MVLKTQKSVNPIKSYLLSKLLNLHREKVDWLVHYHFDRAQLDAVPRVVLDWLAVLQSSNCANLTDG